MKKGPMVVLAVLALSLAASAGSRVKRHTVKLFHPTEINGVELKPGEYAVAVEEGQVIFSQGRKELAKAAVRVEENTGKYSANTMVYAGDEHILLEIRLAGSAEKLLLEGAASAGAGRSTSGKQRP